jgi:ATP-dependent Clp protease ATP-binding subunit ClpA
LKKGFSEEYGARNLERVMDEMLGNLIAEALLSGEISREQKVYINTNKEILNIC